jgi:hypothetical protein
MEAHACNLSTQEAEDGGLRVPCQPGLHSETLPQKTKPKNKIVVQPLANKLWYEKVNSEQWLSISRYLSAVYTLYIIYMAPFSNGIYVTSRTHIHNTQLLVRAGIWAISCHYSHDSRQNVLHYVCVKHFKELLLLMFADPAWGFHSPEWILRVLFCNESLYNDTTYFYSTLWSEDCDTRRAFFMLDWNLVAEF